MFELLAAWVVLLVCCLLMIRRCRGEGTLLLAYFLGLSLIHVPGALNLVGSVARLPGEAESIVGFRATLVGMAALLVGALVVRLVGRPSGRNSSPLANAVADLGRLGQTGRLMLAVGVIASFVLLPLSTIVGSLTSLTSIVASFLIVGYWMVLRDTMNRGKPAMVAALIAALPIMPFATLLFGGFAGFGIMWMIMVSCFYLASARRIAWIAVVAPVIAWIGLSVAVAYFEQRTEIRATVWAERSSFPDRIEKISKIADNFRPYNFNDYRDAYYIDRRLNQNSLVGRGIMRHQAGIVPLFGGSSVTPLALIPRAVWPGKPEIGGGGQLVSAFTGIVFDRSTSVGAGQVLEFYANFGWLGLVIGFLLLGAALGWCDRGLALGFETRDVRKILLFGLPGIQVLQPGGNLVEILVGVIAAIVVARIAGSALSAQAGRNRAATRHPVPARR